MPLQTSETTMTRDDLLAGLRQLAQSLPPSQAGQVQREVLELINNPNPSRGELLYWTARYNELVRALGELSAEQVSDVADAAIEAARARLATAPSSKAPLAALGLAGAMALLFLRKRR